MLTRTRPAHAWPFIILWLLLVAAFSQLFFSLGGQDPPHVNTFLLAYYLLSRQLRKENKCNLTFKEMVGKLLKKKILSVTTHPILPPKCNILLYDQYYHLYVSSSIMNSMFLMLLFNTVCGESTFVAMKTLYNESQSHFAKCNKWTGFCFGPISEGNIMKTERATHAAFKCAL